MPAEIRLSDGTDIYTDSYTAADVIQMLRGDTFISFTDATGLTYQVHSTHVVYVRDA